MALSKQLTLLVRSYPLIILVVIVATLVIGVSMVLNTQKQTPTSQQLAVNTSPSPIPSSNSDGWHINNTQHWATYSSPDAPFSMQYPPQWGYQEQFFENKLHSVAFGQASTPHNGYIIYVLWGGNFGGPAMCDAHPTIQLKNESLSACELDGANGSVGMQIDKITTSLDALIRTSASEGITREQILKILSTFSFTK